MHSLIFTHSHSYPNSRYLLAYIHMGSIHVFVSFHMCNLIHVECRLTHLTRHVTHALSITHALDPILYSFDLASTLSLTLARICTRLIRGDKCATSPIAQPPHSHSLSSTPYHPFISLM